MEQSAAYVAGALGVEVFMVSADARVFFAVFQVLQCVLRLLTLSRHQ